MSWYNTKYKNDNGEYELNTGTLEYEQAKAIEKVCRSVIDGEVKSQDDVSVVVRCKDCKYRFKNNGHDKAGCPIVDAHIWMDDDDFCSHGERKEGAD